ncbi:MAG: EamA family transporter RarD [Coriobacteriales bacterium]|jgi:chloramphenicol-sensitive protein RarD|nr:EamA family transporter RarD [Coriobacteriales bacterium]
MRKGLLYGSLAYVVWGLSPLYWKLLNQVGHFGLVSHRILWSFVFIFIVARLVRSKELKTLIQNKRALILLGTAGVLISVNWGLFIYAVNIGHVLETSLGYFINPLMTILAGLIVFKEKLTLLQKLATILAAVGVVYFTFDYGSFPWLGMSLAILFAVYGAIKKAGSYPAVPALVIETGTVAPLALIFVIISFFLPDNGFLADVSSLGGWATTLLLMGTAVITILPLLWYAEGVNLLPFSWMGFLQYLCPTISFFLGIFAFGEPFTFAHGILFGLIWIGLALISIEVVITTKNSTTSA